MESRNDGNNESSMQNGKYISKNARIANEVISKYTGSNASANKRKQVCPSQSDEEYSKKRARNNVAVKKSREKAKHRIVETQVRVEQLSLENEELQTKVTLLSKELNVLRALFTNGGFALPGGELHVNDNHLEHHHHHSNPTTSSIRQSLTISSDSKSHFDGKVQPIKPMPRISNNNHLSPTNGYSSLHDREHVYNYPHKYSPDCPKKESKGSIGHILAMRLPQEHHNNNLPYASTHSDQHTSVIRTTTAENIKQNNSYSQNSLGKFCIIQDPEKEGQVKIVPIES